MGSRCALEKKISVIAFGSIQPLALSGAHPRLKREDVEEFPNLTDQSVDSNYL
jgi:hypothetical protein